MRTSTDSKAGPLVRSLPPDVVAAVAVAALTDGPTASSRWATLPVDVVADVRVAPANGIQALAADLPLSLKDAFYADDPDHSELPAVRPGGMDPIPLDNARIYSVVREVAAAHSGDDAYQAVSADAEFTAAGHPSAGQRHFGLSFGLVLFTQESGQLGRVLTLWRARNPAVFTEILGPDAEVVLEQTNRPDAAGRLAPIGTAALWSDPWVARLRTAGADPQCQAAQNEQAIEGQFRQLLGPAVDLGLDTERALAMVYDAVVSRGLGAGLRWIVESCTPLRSDAQRAHAVAVLGHPSLAAFQASSGLVRTGVFDATTQASLVGALRRQGTIPLPDAADLSRRLVAAAKGPSRQRLERLWASAALGDDPTVPA